MRTEPRTWNPVLAVDTPTRDLLRLVHADLVRINRETLRTEAVLAEKWAVSRDGKKIDVTLREGLRFSDGAPCTVDDVLFSFQLYLDPKLNSPQRDLLLIGGKPLTVAKTGPRGLRFEFAEAYAPAERLFDSLFIVPKHKLEAAYRAGKLTEAWSLKSPLQEIAGMGPFAAQEYAPGERVVLSRNAHGAKRAAGSVERIIVRFFADANAEALQFRAGALDLISRLPANTFEALSAELQAKAYQFVDAGPSLEYHFLFFNLNGPAAVPPAVAAKQAWFRKREFREAVSLAIDREAIRKLAYGGRAAAIWQPVSPGNRPWFASDIARPARSTERAKALLRTAGFHWNAQGQLEDGAGAAVAFTLALNAANAQHARAATLMAEDLRALGIRVQTVPLEFRSLVTRILEKKDYDAAIMALAAGDADPGPEMPVWLSQGRSHFWNLNPTRLEAWEEEIDRVMRAQMSEPRPKERFALFRRMQQLAAENLPVICFASPHLLSAAKPGWRPMRKAILPPYAWFGLEDLRWEASR